MYGNKILNNISVFIKRWKCPSTNFVVEIWQNSKFSQQRYFALFLFINFFFWHVCISSEKNIYTDQKIYILLKKLCLSSDDQWTQERSIILKYFFCRYKIHIHMCIYIHINFSSYSLFLWEYPVWLVHILNSFLTKIYLYCPARMNY